MRKLIAFIALLTFSSVAAAQQDLATAQREIAPLLQEMLAAANAHDTDRHMAYYIRTADLIFVVNDEAIPGYDSLHVRQLQWWQNGKSDVVYEIAAPAQYRLAAPNVVIQNYTLKGSRTVAGVQRSSTIGVSAVWQKRPEGWRIIYAHEGVVTR